MLETATYLVTKEIAIRSGLVDSRYRIADGRFVLNNRDLSRVRFEPDEYINGLENEEKVTQPVEILQYQWIDGSLVAEGDYTSLGAAGDCAADVAQRAQPTAAGQDKATERRQFSVHLVNLLLQHVHIILGEAKHWSVLAGVFGGKVGTNVEELVLNLTDQLGHFLQVVEFAVVRQQTNVSIQFVYGSVGLDTDVILADTCSAHERRRPFVTRQGVYFTFHISLSLLISSCWFATTT